MTSGVGEGKETDNKQVQPEKDARRNEIIGGGTWSTSLISEAESGVEM